MLTSMINRDYDWEDRNNNYVIGRRSIPKAVAIAIAILVVVVIPWVIGSTVIALLIKGFRITVTDPK